MRLIDADELAAKHPKIASRSMKYNLDRAPTIDAVEVVRCRDCKYAKPVPKAKAPYIADGTFCCLVQRGDETYGVSVVWADGYCDEGEREDGEHGE